MPDGAAIAGPSAAYLYGVEHAAGFTDDVHVIVPPDLRVAPRQGVRVHRARIAPAEVITVGGTTQTTTLRTAWDLACWRDPAPAVTVLDGLLRLGMVGADDLRELARCRAGQRGARAARTAQLGGS